jgi:hypothetical protein
VSEQRAAATADREWVRRSALANDLLISHLFCEHGQARHLRCDECWRRAFLIVGV